MKKGGIMIPRRVSLFFVLISFCASGQDLSGTYYSEFGTKIEIRGNELTYIEPHFPPLSGPMTPWQNVRSSGLMLIL